jgi:hypothetical protein
MLVEATLDFPEEEIDIIRDTDAAQRLERICVRPWRPCRQRARAGQFAAYRAACGAGGFAECRANRRC